MKTAKQLADEAMRAFTLINPEEDNSDVEEQSYCFIRDQIQAAIEADRTQRSTVTVVQDDLGKVVDLFWDASEADAAYVTDSTDSAPHSIGPENIWEPGDYAETWVNEYSRRWAEAVNYGLDEGEAPRRASDYHLSADDWMVGGLDEREAERAEALVRWRSER